MKPIIQIKPIERKSPRNGRMAWYAAKESYEPIMQKGIYEAIARNSQLSPGVVHAACDAIFDSIQNWLMNGHSVEVPGLCSLRPVIHSRPYSVQDEDDGYRADQCIKKVMVRASWAPEVRDLQKPNNYTFTRDGNLYPTPETPNP